MPNDLASPAASGSWHASASELDRVLRGPASMRIDDLGTIRVSGDDAAKFLQSQLTGEVEKQDADTLRLNGYCTAKGRLLAVFWQWRLPDAVLLQLPREILPSVIKRLRMFVLRSKVVLDDVSDTWSSAAVCGPGGAQALAALGLAVPDAPGGVCTAGALRIARLQPSPQVPERFLLLTARAEVDACLAGLAAHGAPHTAAAAWWWTQVDAAIPCVFSATQEKFVPQMVNLEVLDGVSFRKGCYPGQEVVARSQYLGKLRRRMHVARAAGDTRAGADVFNAGDPAPVGTVVMAAAAPGGGTDLLFECAAERLDRPLVLNTANVPPLVVRNLPYELFDPTA
jgi:hypothetical protein